MPETLMKAMLGKPADLKQLNLPEDPNEPAALMNRFVGGVINGPMVGRRPGATNELPEFLGATASTVPLAAIVKMLRGGEAVGQAVGMRTMAKPSNVGDQMLRNHVMPHEFAPVAQQAPLTIEEANKMMELMKPKPEMIGGPGKVSTFAPERFSTSTANGELAKQKAALDAFRREAAAKRGE